MLRLLVWLLIRLTPIFWLGFVYTLVRHVWQYHRPELRLPSLPWFNPVLKFIIVCHIGVFVITYGISTLNDPDMTTEREFSATTNLDLKTPTPIVEPEPKKPPARTVSLPPGAFVPDGTYCRHESTDLSPLVIVCDDNARGHIFAMFKPEPTWDGKSVRVLAKVVTDVPGPNGKMQMNWSGVCRPVGSNRPGIENYEFIRHYYGNMHINFGAMNQGDMVHTETEGNINLTGCKPGDDQLLFIRGQVDDAFTYSTHLRYSYFVWFNAEMGQRQPCLELEEAMIPSQMGRLLSESSPISLDPEAVGSIRGPDCRHEGGRNYEVHR